MYEPAVRENHCYFQRRLLACIKRLAVEWQRDGGSGFYFTPNVREEARTSAAGVMVRSVPMSLRVSPSRSAIRLRLMVSIPRVLFALD